MSREAWTFFYRGEVLKNTINDKMIEVEGSRLDEWSPNTWSTIVEYPVKGARKLRSCGSKPLMARSGQLPWIKSPASTGPHRQLSPIGNL